MQPNLVISFHHAYADQASDFAKRFQLRWWDAGFLEEAPRRKRLSILQKTFSDGPKFFFQIGDKGLELVLWEKGQLLAVRSDFAGRGANYRRRRGGRDEAIARAVGLKKNNPPKVLDATAGLGNDAFVLASLGCKVTMLERSRSLELLIRDGLSRARAAADQADPDLSASLDRLRLIGGDAVEYLEGIEADSCPDVIYLDPMFPERRKSALVKKEMQVLQRLLGQEADVDRLLDRALRKARQRVVVKRPSGAASIGGKQPDHVIKGIRNRYDLYRPIS